MFVVRCWTVWFGVCLASKSQEACRVFVNVFSSSWSLGRSKLSLSANTSTAGSLFWHPETVLLGLKLCFIAHHWNSAELMPNVFIDLCPAFWVWRGTKMRSNYILFLWTCAWLHWRIHSTQVSKNCWILFGSHHVDKTESNIFRRIQSHRNITSKWFWKSRSCLLAVATCVSGKTSTSI